MKRVSINKNLLLVLILKIVGTLFAYYVYSSFTSLGDAIGYATNSELWYKDLKLSLLVDRTSLTELFYSLIQLITQNTLLSFLFASISSGYIIYKSLSYSEIFKQKLFWIVFMMPHFLIWTGVTSKEAISVVLFTLLASFIHKIYINLRVNFFGLALTLLLCFIYRPHYALGYFFLLNIAIFQSYFKKDFRFSLLIYFYLICIAFLIIITILIIFYPDWKIYFEELMSISRNFYIGFDNATANRTYLFEEWNTAFDYFRVLFLDGWVLTAFIGTSFNEAITRTPFALVYIEGIISFTIMFYLFFVMYLKSIIDNKFRFIFYFGIIPSFLIIIFVHSPFSIFNPGTAVRYKQALVPIIYFLPLLFLSTGERNS